MPHFLDTVTLPQIMFVSLEVGEQSRQKLCSFSQTELCIGPGFLLFNSRAGVALTHDESEGIFKDVNTGVCWD